MASKSPTQRSLEYLREQGYHCEIVEKWNPWRRIRQDLWGWCDILAIRRNEVLAVQVTSSGVAARIKKIQDSDTIALVREAGIRVEVHGWTKRSNGRYALRVEDIS
jgi:SH3-like domain-containing protein